MERTKTFMPCVRTAALLVALWLIPSPGHADYCPALGNFLTGQGPYIGGIVTDADGGLPFSSVRLVLYCCESGTDYNQTSSDVLGRYSFGGETDTLGFWITACYNARVDDACYETVERIEITPPTCPRPGETDCFEFVNCDDQEGYQVDFKVRDTCCGPLQCGGHPPLLTAGRPSGDRLRLSSLLFSSSVTIDPPNEDVTVTLEDADGLIYTATIPAGSFKKSYHGWLFKDPTRTVAGGILRARISKSGSHYKLKAVASGLDLSAADKSPIRITLTIGDDCFRTTNNWTTVHKYTKQCVP